MPQTITIVMYHYVRELKDSRFPSIKGLEITAFKKQLEYLLANYTIITAEELMNALNTNQALPNNPALLTFDDAYKDHFDVVFPILFNKGIQGSFYVPSKAIQQHLVLDVNKIHFVIAANDNVEQLITFLKERLTHYKSLFSLQSFDFYYTKLAKASRLDTKEVIFIKRLLQSELPESLRNIITNELFNEFVDLDEKAFSKELYMSEDQIKTLYKTGMHIGVHGNDHYWLETLSRKEQEKEIALSLQFLEKLLIPLDYWTMCYPYGSYNNDTLELLNENNCQYALTTIPEIANISSHNRYKLPRLDTVDLPR